MATLTDAQTDEPLAGKLYFNLHTEKKGGESCQSSADQSIMLFAFDPSAWRWDPAAIYARDR
jgi:hypothetical protein